MRRYFTCLFLLLANFAHAELSLLEAAKKVDEFFAAESFGGAKLASKYKIWKLELVSSKESPHLDRRWKATLSKIGEKHEESENHSKDGKGSILVINLNDAGEALLDFEDFERHVRVRRVSNPELE